VYDQSIRTLALPANVMVRSAVWSSTNEPLEHDRERLNAQRQPPAAKHNGYLLLCGVGIGIGMAAAVGMVALFGIAIAAAVGVAALFRGKCSACGRTQAMKKTGNTQRGTGWLATTKDEWQCRYCGDTTWTTQYACLSGGCGGTSGCSSWFDFGGGDAGCGGGGCGGGGCGGGGCGGGGCGGG
jgi:hypothetical protein